MMLTGVLVVVLIFSLGVLVWMVSMLIADNSAAVYVPTDPADMEAALLELKMTPGKSFVDLGSGDGRMVMSAARNYQVEAVGYEINPLLVIYARLLTTVKKISGVRFYTTSFWNADLSEFDYVYMYLYPPAMKKLAVKMEKELKKGSIVVSKAFEIKEWKDKLVKKLMIGEKVLWVYQR